MPRPRAVERDTGSASKVAARPLLSRASLLALCVAIAASTGLIHWQVIDLRRFYVQVAWHNRIIEGHAPYPDQYRILTYFLAQALIKVGVPFTLAHVALRFVFTAASLYVFHQYLRAWVRPSLALVGLFMLAAALPLTFLFYFMQPTDPLNMLVFFAAFAAFQSGRDRWLIPLTFVGMLNRETAGLVPVLYALVRFRAARLSRWLPHFGIAAAAAVATYAGLRIVYGLAPPYAEISPLRYWADNLMDFSAWIQLFGFFNLGWWIGWRQFRAAPPFLRRAAWLVPVFLIVHFSAGYVREIRYFLPILPVVVPLTLITLERRLGGA